MTLVPPRVHAQERMVRDGISDDAFRDALFNGKTIPDGHGVVWREKDGVRVVILRHEKPGPLKAPFSQASAGPKIARQVRQPTPFKGAMLAETVYRVQMGARAIKR